MTGQQIRLNKLFAAGNTVVVAVDHGEFDGPIPMLENVPAVVEKINPAVDAILLSPGMIAHCGKSFAFKGAPLPIVRINWATTYCFTWHYGQGETVAAVTPAQAAASGAEAVLISLSLRTGSERRDAENVKVFADLAQQAKACGLPVIGEYFPARGEDVTGTELHEEVKIGARILAELGADAIKTFHTERFKEVVGGCPVPVWALGAKKLPKMSDALELARKEIADGARGVVFGRNAFSWPESFRFQAALVEVVRNGKSAQEALAGQGLK
ncbi:MAG: hypothetical protein IT443_07495 [Phycisphaeraceae bacterium]|nr:hypothetical protein [Phycisphaeraceae bacterium]